MVIIIIIIIIIIRSALLEKAFMWNITITVKSSAANNS